MRTVTRCPACQTQFFVTETQLNKHDGKVRCGQCLHVFNAKKSITDAAQVTITSEESSTNPPISTASNAPLEIPHDGSVREEITSASTDKNETWPSISSDLLTDDAFAHQEFEQFSERVELSATHEEIEAFTAEALPEKHLNDSDSNKYGPDDRILLDEHDFDDTGDTPSQAQVKKLNDITQLTYVADKEADYFSDLAKASKRNAKKLIKNNLSTSRRWVWLLGSLILFLVALTQSIYFLRNEISIYYPKTKPYLLQICHALNCSLSLPRQIEYILIDDSDMQEDEQHARLMYFSSSLINKAPFNQAYPDLELTLTDTDDNPILRRVFKPADYLPVNTNSTSGFQSGAEIKIKLAITTHDTPVAGYRVYVTY